MSGLFSLPAVEPVDREEAEPAIGPAGSSLEFLQAIYRDAGQPISRRLRAAIAALPFEHPKLAVVASMHANEGFAERLEAAIARSRNVIEVSASNEDSLVR